MKTRASIAAFVAAFLVFAATAQASKNDEYSVNHVRAEQADLERIEDALTGKNGYSNNDEEYLKVRRKVIRKKGLGAAERNIVMDGRASGKKATDAKIATRAETLLAKVAPPPPPEPEPVPVAVAPEPEPVTTEAAPAPATGGGYAIPDYIVQCESGGDYNAQNPSGAYGAYQIMPGTAAAYGCDLSTPAGQDACAAEIYAREGASPWVCG